jgi:triosephosphate isomerase
VVEEERRVLRKLVVGNWKMTGSLAQLVELSAIAEAARIHADVDVAVCPPVTLIAPAAATAGTLSIGAQDVHCNPHGPHTGCVSAAMLKEAGASLVIVGHSERRQDQRERDQDIRAKAEAALAAGLQTIVCVGESDAERRSGRAVEVVTNQLGGSLPDSWSAGELVVAYEPIWAIGTGNVATPQDVADMHAAIRRNLVERFGESGARIRILYGGSVKADNAAELFSVRDVDGALVGGASLTAAQFIPIIEAAG